MKPELPLDFEVPCDRELHTLTVTPELELVVHDHNVKTAKAFRVFGATRPPRCIEIWEAWQRSPGQGLYMLAPLPEEVLTIAWAGDEDLRGYVGFNWHGLPLVKRYELLSASSDRWINKTIDHGGTLSNLMRAAQHEMLLQKARARGEE